MPYFKKKPVVIEAVQICWFLGAAVIDHGTTLRNVTESRGYLPVGFKDAEDFQQAIHDLFHQIQAQYS